MFWKLLTLTEAVICEGIWLVFSSVYFTEVLVNVVNLLMSLTGWIFVC